MYDPDVLNKLANNEGPNYSFQQNDRSQFNNNMSTSKKPSQAKNSVTNSVTMSQGKRTSNNPNTILPTNENSQYQQTRESNESNFKKSSLVFGKGQQETLLKATNEININTTNNNRTKSKSPLKKPMINASQQKKAPNTASLKKPTRNSLPPQSTNTRGSLNKSKIDDDGVELINPFGDENPGQMNFKARGSVKKNGDEDFVTGLINDGYVDLKDISKWKELCFRIKLTEKEYNLMIREKANLIKIK